MGNNSDTVMEILKKFAVIFITAFLTALMSALATYIYTVKSENQKNITALKIQSVTDFGNTFSAMSLDFYEIIGKSIYGKAITDDQKSKILTNIFKIQIDFPFQSHRLPNSSSESYKKFSSNLAKFRENIENAKLKNDFKDSIEEFKNLLKSRDDFMTEAYRDFAIDYSIIP